MGAAPVMLDDEVRRNLVDIYRRVNFLSGLYVRARLSLAPMLEVARYVPLTGDIIDLGCGHGIFAQILHLYYPNRKIVGIDCNESRIRVAAKTTNDSNLHFVVGDVGEVDWDCISVVTIVDLLHHMPFDAQEKLLRRAAHKLTSRGLLLIKDLGTRPRWKYWFHYLQDTLSYRTRLYFRSSEEMLRVLYQLGFSVRVVDLAQRRPHPHVLYLCTKI